MKRCFKCGRRKPRRLFYRHPMMADGRLGKCKHCAKRDVRRRYQEKHGVVAAYDRRRFQDPRRRALVARYQGRTRERYPGKKKARVAVGNALRNGRLTRGPCARCGTADRVQAHHKDYRRPLVVTWLCFRCHREGEHGQRTSR